MKIINYLLAGLVFIMGLSKLLMPLELLNILGLIFHLLTGTLIIIKPKAGYIFLVFLVILTILPYVLYSVVANY